jgi:Leucine-rich repeat (LRR) protein
LTDIGLAGLEFITTLEELSLSNCQKLTSVTNLAASKSLKKLNLSQTRVTDAGLARIECIETLEDLSLAATRVTSVTNLAASKSLKKLDLSQTRVTDAGLARIDSIATLEVLLLVNCKHVTEFMNPWKPWKILNLEGTSVLYHTKYFTYLRW